MNFFEQQQQARRRTTVAVLLFILAVLAVVATTDAVVLAAIAFLNVSPYAPPAYYTHWIAAHPRAILWTSLITTGLIAGASMYRMVTLSSGGRAVAQSLGGTRIDTGTRDPLRRQLVNVIEETAIAAGVPVPAIYVLESEGGINAFAAGYGPSDAVIAVTRGALETLTRDELQGVVAHEFSHILNGDMRLNMRLIGASFGILVIALAGRLLLRGVAQSRGSSSNRSGQALLLGMAMGLTLVTIGYIGVLFTRLIKAVVSRNRETLADASAVQYTRNPAGLAGALKKIAVSPLRATLTATESAEVEHMLIAEPRGSFDALFASHPPLLDRIRALEPSFDPAELERIRLTPMTAGAPVAAPAPMSPAAQLAALPLTVVATIGNPGAAQRTAAAVRHANIPEALQDAAHSTQDAVAVVLAVLLSQEAATRERQLAHLRTRLASAPATVQRLEALASQTARLDPALRLSVTSIAFPALRHRPVEQLRAVAALVDELLHMDGALTVLDYALARLIRNQVQEVVAPPVARPAAAALKLYDLQAELRVLFAVMADSGHDDEPQARSAFDAGMRRLLPMTPPEYLAARDWTDALDHALGRLDRLPPAIKQQLIEALELTVTHDHQLTLGESELLRVVCASLHCPLPPLLAAA